MTKKFNHGRIKPKHEHKNSGKGKLLIPDFIKWLKSNFHGEVHHFYGNQNGGKMDCFIKMIPPDLHRQIHFGDIGVQGYIDQEGEYELVSSSIELLQEWVIECSRYEYQTLIDEIIIDTSNCIEIAKAYQV